MAVKTVSITELRRLLAGDGHEPLTEMAISKFVKDGMPKAARGQYDPTACMVWYIGRLRTSVQQRKTEGANGEQISLDDAQIRLTTAKAENEEMTAAERRGELMPLSLHISETAKLITVTKQRLLNLPGRIAPKLADLSRHEAKALLAAAINGALMDLAKGPTDVVDESATSPERKPTTKRTRPRAPRKSRARK